MEQNRDDNMLTALNFRILPCGGSHRVRFHVYVHAYVHVFNLRNLGC